MNKEETKDLKIRFGIWLGLPPDARDPKGQKELADILGVTDVSLSRWKKDPLVLSIQKNALQTFAAGHDFEIMQTMIERAKEGHAQMTKLYWQWRGQLDSKSQETKEPQEIIVKLVKVGTEHTSPPSPDEVHREPD